jgi:ribonucleoside-diphosphate reductase alpha chain
VDEAPPALSGASALKPRPDEGITAQSEAIAAPAEAAASAPAAATSTTTEKATETPLATAVSATPAAKEELAVVASNGSANGHAGNGNGKGNGLAAIATSLGGGTKVAFAAQADAPSCAECGSIMVRNGSCYKCLNCGSTSGCS